MADFRDSVQKCAGTYKLSEYDYLNQELIPVDKLRYFHKERVTKVYGDKKGLFRINAIKFNNTWYEYYHSDLQKVNFNHFEDFDVTQGDNGMLYSISGFKRINYVFPHFRRYIGIPPNEVQNVICCTLQCHQHWFLLVATFMLSKSTEVRKM